MAALLKELGIESHADWRSWCRKHHPDKGGDKELFQFVNLAVQKHLPSNKSEVPPSPPPPRPPSNADTLRELYEKMFEKAPPPDAKRCTKVRPNGSRCMGTRYGSHSLCHVHYRFAHPEEALQEQAKRAVDLEEARRQAKERKEAAAKAKAEAIERERSRRAAA